MPVAANEIKYQNANKYFDKVYQKGDNINKKLQHTHSSCLGWNKTEVDRRNLVSPW